MKTMPAGDLEYTMSENRKIFFVSGLPRSGSTLFSAIMRQNPLLEAGMTSPVGSLTTLLRVAMSNNVEVASLLNDDSRAKILRGIFHGYYSHLPEETIVFDTNRAWTGRLPELLALFGGEVKMIALVRDPAWIMDSVERIVRASPMRQSKLVAPGSTVKSRSETMMSNEGLIGAPLANLLDALSGPDSHRVLLLEYDALVRDPKQAVDGVYRFLDLPAYDHDFSSVEYKQEGFDDVLMTPGLHDVSGPVRAVDRQTVLPLDIFERLSSAAFWRSDFKTQAKQIVLR